jgi:hypothetical protein
MPIYRYSKTISLKKDETATLHVIFEEQGIAAHHLIDLPGPNDKQALDQCSVDIGTLQTLEAERTLIFTKAISINPNATEIPITYKINNKTIVKHTNPKTEDPSPQIIVTLRFKEA